MKGLRIREGRQSCSYLVDLSLLFVQSVLNKMDTKHQWYYGSSERAMNGMYTLRNSLYSRLFIQIHTYGHVIAHTGEQKNLYFKK